MPFPFTAPKDFEIPSTPAVPAAFFTSRTTYSPRNGLMPLLGDALCRWEADDPLASARQRAVAARGGNGFMSVAASQAALLLAQGAGRLLRTMSDRGVVAVLDPRLVTARYGDFLRKSLPPFWTTQDPAVDLAFCLGNFPQLVRNFHLLATGAADLASLRPNPGRLCGWCAFQQWCPAFGGDPADAPRLASVG